MTADTVSTEKEGSTSEDGTYIQDQEDDAGFEPIQGSRPIHNTSIFERDNAHPKDRGQTSSILMDEAEVAELRRIATTLSQKQSTVVSAGASGTPTLSMVDENDPAIDPQSSQFDMQKWLHRFIRLHREEGIGSKQIGVVYKNVNVFGSGDALQVQQTVGSFLSAPLRIGELLSFGKKAPKQILHHFDGLIQSGELLLVLGRPGSGCSTLLKTISGELKGLEFGPETDIHYNGIPQKQMKEEFKGDAIYNQEVCISSSKGSHGLLLSYESTPVWTGL
jgi:ABC-type antimicrobial peptide transport system ATPase subunit